MSQWHKIDRDVRDELGEGVTWSARQNALYWVDILAPALNRLSLATGAVERWEMPELLGWVVEDQNGNLIGGFRNGLARISLEPRGATPVLHPEPHLPGNRMNDGKADPHGAIWFGTMEMAEEHPQGSLYRLAPGGKCERVDSGYMVPNGPAFSPCGHWLYHTDTARRTIYRFAFDGQRITEKRPFITFAEEQGYPDGMTTDCEGGLWVAHWDGGRISRFTPDGALDRSIALPARRVTNICFAGEQLERMFVTTAAKDLPVTEYHGALYEVDCGTTGLPTHSYGDRL
ncbi:SMP-30/gluconolactonase/LRE family protein [Novosphingobium sp. M1R2S20]|uniref:SMP-30/gluconolactonase/LRE family protein n=1 Tax=Novosphingobium rhizovicinum TaxID=3228928 RepID=A0ABV3RG58_9SPHN